MIVRPLVVILAIVLASGSCSTVSAQSGTAVSLTRNTRLASADLRSDLQVLRRAYETLHPGLYRYNSPTQVTAQFDAVDRYFSIDRTLGETFLALTRLTAAIRCGHSYPNFWNQSDAVASALFEGRDKLPFRFRWIGRQMIVTSDSRDLGLPRGTRILSIDGVETAAILDSLMPLARSDGSNDAKRVSYLAVDGPDRYHAFDVLYPLVFPGRDTGFALVVERPGSDRDSLRVPAIDGVTRRAEQNALADSSPDAPQWFFKERDGLAVLTMPTWALYDSKWDYRGWTDSLFDHLVQSEVPDLVLDLRENEGGVDAGNLILARIIDKPLTLPRYRRYVRYRRIPDDLVPVLDTWDPSFRDWGEKAVGPVDSMFYRLTRWDDDTTGSDVIQPKGPKFRGRVWVLTGPTNSSATFQFALAVSQSKIATLVGQPTGGNRRGINGGAFFFVRLPRTGLELDLPLVAGFPDSPEPDSGVVPDIPETPSVHDVVEGRDAELSRVREEIQLKFHH
jgi:hypothetical protein